MMKVGDEGEGIVRVRVEVVVIEVVGVGEEEVVRK